MKKIAVVITLLGIVVVAFVVGHVSHQASGPSPCRDLVGSAAALGHPTQCSHLGDGVPVQEIEWVGRFTCLDAAQTGLPYPIGAHAGQPWERVSGC